VPLLIMLVLEAFLKITFEILERDYEMSVFEFFIAVWDNAPLTNCFKGVSGDGRSLF
jgi:hypothetical protein